MPTNEERSAFYARTFLAAGALLFILSLALNASVIFSRFLSARAPIQEKASMALPEQAFGTVDRGFSVRPQAKIGTTALASVSSYVLPSAISIDLPPSLQLYRDQGVVLDEDVARHILSRVGVSADLSTGQLVPSRFEWKTSDGGSVRLDAEKRTLVFEKSIPTAMTGGEATDAELVRNAGEFLESFGVDILSYGTPTVLRSTGEFVHLLYPLTVDGFPVVDMDGVSVPALDIALFSKGGTPISATLMLLRPEILSSSAYPTASREKIRALLQSGGMLPVQKGLKGKAVSVAYSGVKTVYMLCAAEPGYPTYLIPVVWATWSQASCPTCDAVTLGTFVPALDPASFSWVEEK